MNELIFNILDKIPVNLSKQSIKMQQSILKFLYNDFERRRESWKQSHCLTIHLNTLKEIWTQYLI